MSAQELFSQTYESFPETLGKACGRINIIGEHLDYNGGTVLPTVIDREVSVTMSSGEAEVDEIYSYLFNESVRRSIHQEFSHHWSDYVGGALQKARELGLIIGGVRVTAESNLHYGAGVSSSAAVIIATLRAALQLADRTTNAIELSKWAQEVENSYIGMPCGIMDQMAIAAAHPGSALALNTKTLESTLIKLPVDHHFIGVFSGFSRRLDEGRYAKRREECEQASAQLGVADLCLMSETQYADIDQLDDNIAKRARHAYTEQARVLKAIQAFLDNDIEMVGQLMTQSHLSMRDDFEISIPEINELVDGAIKYGALGARLTGGGFGGCIVACVHDQILPQWREDIQHAFPNAQLVN